MTATAGCRIGTGLTPVVLMHFVVMLGGAASAFSQGVAPALLVEQGGKHVPLRVSQVAVETRILGYLAQTSMTMTFASAYDRPLAGELYFPLPQGAVVSGYALDIQGKLVDGVVVEKDRGRQVLEKEIRKGVDPGLVEWTRGNNFRTRVFPIPPRGSRTVRVTYVSELPPGKGVTSWCLPLNFRQKVDQFRLRIEVVRPAARPVIARGGPEGMAFQDWQDGFVAEKELRDAAPANDLVIDLPEVEKQRVLVEKDEQGDIYFAIHDLPTPPAAAATNRPTRVTVFWDASGSRGQAAARKREIDLLTRFLAGTSTQVDLVVFRNAAEPARRFDVRDEASAAALAGALASVPYDGGTQLGCISPAAGAEPPDLYLLFSDGLSNVGREEVTGLKAPLIALSADSSADHTLLESLAGRTGGQYLNLSRLEDRAALDLMGKPVFAFLSASIDGKELAAGDLTYPSQPQAVQGQFTLAGKLPQPSKGTTVVLRYGLAGKTTLETTADVSPAAAASGTMLRRLWGQKKVEQLLARPQANQAQIVETGKSLGLVTPYTSLIVLETLEQYLEHEIAPPKTLPEMRNQYLAEMDARAARKKTEDRSKLDRVLAMWNERVKWWQAEYKYPKDFRYKEPKEKKDETAITGAPRNDEGRPRESGIEGEQRGGAAPRPVAPAPAAEPLGQAVRNGGAANGLFQSEVDKSAAGGGRTPQPGVVIKEWDPKTPYLEAIRKVPADQQYDAYLAQRKAYAASPAFFLDCGDYFLKSGQGAVGLRVLSNLAELELENAAMVRVLAHKLAQLGELDLAAMAFEEALSMRPEEPQSYRDLALVLARRGIEYAQRQVRRRTQEQAQADTDRVRADLARAMDLLAKVVMGTWDRFEEIEVIALMELNSICAQAERLMPGQVAAPVDPRLIKLLDCDVRILLTWDADMTDIDLHVVEPSTERAFYGHNRTTIGGLVSKDFTQGYGPEEYVLRKAMNGTYKVEINYYGSSAASVQGAVTVQAEVITNFGRPDEKRRTMTLRLTDKKETFPLGQIEF